MKTPGRTWGVDFRRAGRDYITAIDMLVGSPAAQTQNPFTARFFGMAKNAGAWRKSNTCELAPGVLADVSIHARGAAEHWAFAEADPPVPARAADDFDRHVDPDSILIEGDRIRASVRPGPVLLEQMMEVLRAAAQAQSPDQRWVVSGIVGSPECLRPVQPDDGSNLRLTLTKGTFRTFRFALTPRKRGFIMFSVRTY